MGPMDALVLVLLLAGSTHAQGHWRAADRRANNPKATPATRTTLAKRTTTTKTSATAHSYASWLHSGTTSSATSSVSTRLATSTSVKASSSTSAPTAAATSIKAPNVKKGLGYNTVSYTYGFTDVSWVYNWSPSVYGGKLPTYMEFLPMFWGPGSTPNWPQNAQTGITNGATHLLGMNEPDLDSQSNITPRDAAAIWKTNMEPFHGKAKLVSPAITNGGAPMGVQWMKEFMGNCTGCHVDAIAMHWYDSATNVGYFTNYFTEASKAFGLPIWVTEFAGYGTVAQQQTFLNTVVPWLDAQPFIERYAAFGDFDGTFVYNNGTLTPLGVTYNKA